MTTIRKGSIGARIISYDIAFRTLVASLSKKNPQLADNIEAILDAAGPRPTYNACELDVVTREAVAERASVDSATPADSPPMANRKWTVEFFQEEVLCLAYLVNGGGDRPFSAPTQPFHLPARIKVDPVGGKEILLRQTLNALNVFEQIYLRAVRLPPPEVPLSRRILAQQPGQQINVLTVIVDVDEAGGLEIIITNLKTLDCINRSLDSFFARYGHKSKRATASIPEASPNPTPESIGERILYEMGFFIHTTNTRDLDSSTVSHTEWLHAAVTESDGMTWIHEWAISAVMRAERIMWELNGAKVDHRPRLTRFDFHQLANTIRVTRSRSPLPISNQASDYIMVRWMPDRPDDLAVVFKRGDLVEVATRHVRAYKAIQHAIRKGAES